MARRSVMTLFSAPADPWSHRTRLVLAEKGIAIELVNVGEGETIAADRASRRSWLEARDYRVLEIRAADVERDLEAELARLQGMMAE